ncbi:MAG TPA: ribose-phosphate pyrophosphokinase [Ktedonobacterales bacterium]|nr:ribose-phosphate pyrophosphokinase [Ktedonobacterales bacterium]
MNTKARLFMGSAHPALAESIARALGIPLSGCTIERFPDGEVSVRLNESVRGCEVYVVQPTAPPVDEHVMELLIFADACRRAAATRITAIVPYFGYARQDRRRGRREPITASMVAMLMQAVGIDQVMVVDIHSDQIEGFFMVPMDTLTATPVLCAAVKPTLTPGVVVVSPDVGRVAMATDYARRLQTTVVVLHKHRESGSQTSVTHVVGDVAERPCLVIDDMISTGGTIARSIEALLGAGARPDITIAATHGLFVGDARNVLSHPSVRGIYVTDTIPQSAHDWELLHVVSVAPLLAAAIEQVDADGSLSDLR